MNWHDEQVKKAIAMRNGFNEQLSDDFTEDDVIDIILMEYGQAIRKHILDAQPEGKILKDDVIFDFDDLGILTPEETTKE